MKRNIQKQNSKKSGLYKITNLINSKFYIGSTKNFSERYRSHCYCLKNNKSQCIILQNAVNKYGIDNFEFSVLEVCDNYKEREIEYFEENFPDYNSIKETRIKREISEKTKKKMSIAQINSYKNGRKPYSPKGKKINMVIMSEIKLVDIETNEITEWESVKKCAKHFSCSPQALYNCKYRNLLFKHKYRIIITKS